MKFADLSGSTVGSDATVIMQSLSSHADGRTRPTTSYNMRSMEKIPFLLPLGTLHDKTLSRQVRTRI